MKGKIKIVDQFMDIPIGGVALIKGKRSTLTITKGRIKDRKFTMKLPTEDIITAKVTRMQ